MAYLVRNSETIFKGKAFGVRIDEVESHTGHVMQVDVIEHSGSVVLIPIDDNGMVWFVRQYRHPAGSIMLELPAGTLDQNEEPEACAVRECREEIGMMPGSMISLGWAYLAPGYSTELAHFFLVERLSPAPLDPDEHEDLHIERLSWESIFKMISENELDDAKSLAGLFLARTHLGELASLPDTE